MKEIFSNYFKMSYIASIIFLLLGILLCIDPEGIIVTISIMIGTIALIFGVFEFILYLQTKTNTSLFSGVFSLMTGIVLLLNTNLLAIIVPVIIGIAMIIHGVKKLEIAAAFREQDISSWPYMFVVALLTLICGIIFVINPVIGAIITTQIVGIMIIIYSVATIVDNIIFRDKFKKISKIIEEVK